MMETGKGQPSAEPSRPVPLATPTDSSDKTPRSRFVLRFHRNDRLIHGVLMASFLTLALTGIPLLFPQAPWATTLANLLGGYRVTGVLHRIAAVTLMLVFGTHLARLGHRLFVRKDYGMLWGPKSLVPQPIDLVQLVQHFRWFVGLGPQPRFDRYSYWEKFDYWAVFWGMAIIGTSGLMLWFPAFFARFLPGWLFNIALVVHGEEALMAMVFIFTVHFFNGHLRPDKFPMDLVIFTGRVSLDELKHERPAEYERLVAEDSLGKVLAEPPSIALVTVGRIIGTTAVTIGLIVAGLAIYALLR
jgi:cytochrome b subunit of formate dehydrogenase